MSGVEKPQDETGTEDTTTEEPTREETAEGEPGAAVKDDGTPVTAADWSALNEALRKSRQEARAARRGKSEPAIAAPEAEQVVKDAAAAAEAKYKPLVIKAHARSAFVEAGLVLPKDNADGALARALKLIDMDDLDITDDGAVDGLREQVEEIRVLFPELFATRKAARVDAAGKGQGAPKPVSSADAIAGMLTTR